MKRWRWDEDEERLIVGSLALTVKEAMELADYIRYEIPRAGPLAEPSPIMALFTSLGEDLDD